MNFWKNDLDKFLLPLTVSWPPRKMESDHDQNALLEEEIDETIDPRIILDAEEDCE